MFNKKVVIISAIIACVLLIVLSYFYWSIFTFEGYINKHTDSYLLEPINNDDGEILVYVGIAQSETGEEELKYFYKLPKKASTRGDILSVRNTSRVIVIFEKEIYKKRDHFGVLDIDKLTNEGDTVYVEFTGDYKDEYNGFKSEFIYKKPNLSEVKEQIKLQTE